MTVPTHHEAAGGMLAWSSIVLALAAASLDDVKFVISIATSLAGAAVGLYIVERGRLDAARLKRDSTEAEEHRRQALLDWEQKLLQREVEAARRHRLDVESSETGGQ